jgi:hypothetical protein
MVTLSDEEAQGALDMVHWKTEEPAVNPVIPEL